MSDKAEAIAPYAYHLVLENNYIDNFWTEKLADAWIGWALPLYLGAPNLAAACGLPDGFVALDPDDEEGNLARIAQCLGRRFGKSGGRPLPAAEPGACKAPMSLPGRPR